MDAFKERKFFEEPSTRADEERLFESVKSEKISQPDNKVKEREEVYHSSIAPSIRRVPVVETYNDAYASTKIISLIYYIASVLSLFIGLRFILLLVGARGNSVVNVIYSLTEPLVSPFRGVSVQSISFGTARFEIESIIAILAIGIVAFILAGLVRLLGKDSEAV